MKNEDMIFEENKDYLMIRLYCVRRFINESSKFDGDAVVSSLFDEPSRKFAEHFAKTNENVINTGIFETMHNQYIAFVMSVFLDMDAITQIEMVEAKNKLIKINKRVVKYLKFYDEMAKTDDEFSAFRDECYKTVYVQSFTNVIDKICNL